MSQQTRIHSSAINTADNARRVAESKTEIPEVVLLRQHKPSSLGDAKVAEIRIALSRRGTTLEEVIAAIKRLPKKPKAKTTTTTKRTTRGAS